MEAARSQDVFGAGLRSEIERRHVGEGVDVGALRGKGHLVFLPGPSGYVLTELPGPAPKVGTSAEVEGIRLRVARIGRSPLPADRRRCAFYEVA